MVNVAENIWLFRYPLKMLGADLRRNTTVIRLKSGQLVIHSMGPFTPEDAANIRLLGQPGWLAETMLRHDTFAKEGREAFPGLPFLAPPGFSERVNFPTLSLLPPPAEWKEAIEVLKVEGAPSLEEHLFFHVASRTLIVADLAFNFGTHEPAWTELLLKLAVGGKHEPGMSRPFREAIKDEEAFKRSMEKMLRWDFDRVIVGHGDLIERDGKLKIKSMLRDADLEK